MRTRKRLVGAGAGGDSGALGADQVTNSPGDCVSKRVCFNTSEGGRRPQSTRANDASARHEKEGSNQVSTRGRDTIQPAHFTDEQTEAQRGSEMFKAVAPKCSLQTLASESPRALVREQTPRPSHVGAGRLREADRGVGSRPRPFPSAHSPATWPSQAIRAGAVFLGIPDHSNLPPPAHVGPGPFSYSRLLVWPSVCQLIPSTSQCHEVHTGTVLDAAQILSESSPGCL